MISGKNFDPDVLDIAFSGCKAVYLQIRWEGWFVRPVRELTKEQLTVLVGLAVRELTKEQLTNR